MSSKKARIFAPRWLLAVIVFCGPSFQALAQKFTIEQAMSAPFPEMLRVAPAGGAVAWVFDERGARIFGWQRLRTIKLAG